MEIRKLSALLLSAALSAAASAGTGNALIGWQTFENAGANNNSGIDDTTPDTNSTFYPTSGYGVSNSGHYLTGAIGPSASSLGRNGFGQSANSGFLNGDRFGGAFIPPNNQNGELIVDWPLADGSPGVRIGPNGCGAGCASSWKFANDSGSNPQNLQGDFSITNHSDFYFRLEFVHFDARSQGAATSPTDLDFIYLASSGNLIRKDNGNEVADLQPMYSTSWTPGQVQVQNISRNLGAPTNTQVFLPPGETAAFRFRWTGNSGAGEAQIDNLAFEGTFFETAELINAVDPESLSLNIPTLPHLFMLMLGGLLCLVTGKRISRRV